MTAGGRRDRWASRRGGAKPSPRYLPSRLEALETCAAMLNESAEGSGVQRQELLRKAEERLAQERHLAQAEKFATIGRLSGSVAHELGSALSVIGLRAAAIVQQTQGSEPAHQQALAIADEVARVTAFIQRLLDLSRRHTVVFRSVNVCELVESATADLVSPSDSGHIEILLSAAGEPVFVHGDEAMLFHAVRNVVRNAVQALRDRQRPGRIEIGVREERGNVLISVEDNGPGIAADQIAHVFEPFHTTKPNGEGLGLGLPISHGIIMEHHGDMRIANRPAGGVVVTIRLPRDPGHEEPRA